MNDPLETIRQLWAAAVADSPLRQKNAVCLSTLDEDGFPNSRFMDLRAVDTLGLVFLTNLESPKARNIANNSRSGATVFWDHIGIQIRIRGHCSPLDDLDADRFWMARPRDAQLTTLSFAQSAPITGHDELPGRLQKSRDAHCEVETIGRPSFWGGFVLVPFCVEILRFMPNRLHERTFFFRTESVWTVQHLQP